MNIASAKKKKSAVPATQVAFLLYPDFDILDVSGPFAMLQSGNDRTGIQPVLAAEKKGLVRSLEGVSMQATHTFDEVAGTPVFWVPGGYGDGFNAQFNKNGKLLRWLQANGPKAKYVCSVCTGGLILGASGLLYGYTATTHWAFQSNLTQFPGVTLAHGYPRYWIDGNRITGGGVSSGLDESLALLACLAGKEAAMSAQLMNQYAPDPPYHAGTPLTADPEFLGYFNQNAGNMALQLMPVIDKFLAGK